MWHIHLIFSLNDKPHTQYNKRHDRDTYNKQNTFHQNSRAANKIKLDSQTLLRTVEDEITTSS